MKDVQLHLRADCHKVLRQDDAYLKEELVAGDLLDELAWVGSVELDPQVEGDGADPLDLLRHSLRRVQPMLQNIQRSDAGCGSLCDKDEGSDWKGRRADAIPSLCVRPSMPASGYYVRPRIDLWRCLLPISIVNEGSRARGVVGPPQGLGRCTRRGQGQEAGRHDLSADISSDNTGDCRRKEVLVKVGRNK